MTDPKGPRDNRWYLSLVSPNTKGPKFARLDPTSICINAMAFQDQLDGVIADLAGVEFGVVGGFDAMDFVRVRVMQPAPGAVFCRYARQACCVSTPTASASPTAPAVHTIVWPAPARVGFLCTGAGR